MSKYDKLVDTTSKGLACVCFRNQDGLSLAEINEMFSEHGNVVGINCAGDNLGYRFVRFREKEEALKCAIAFDGHPSIHLQPVRLKNKESNENYQHDKLTKSKRENIRPQKTEQIADNSEQTDKENSTKGSVSSRKSRTNNYQRKNTDNQFQSGHSSINNLDNKNGETSNKNLNTHQYATNNQNSIANRLNLRSVQKFPRSNESEDIISKIENQNDSINAVKLAQLHKQRGIIASTFQVPGNDLTNNVPALVGGPVPLQIISNPPSSNHSSRQSVMTDMPPPLAVPSLHSGRSIIPEEKIKVVLASDVIVANIHSNIGVSNIYQMFEKFSPIYVSDIETVPEINVRFCYAYFETLNDAIEVEQSFDGLPVFGQNLITLRSHRLEAETGIF